MTRRSIFSTVGAVAALSPTLKANHVPDFSDLKPGRIQPMPPKPKRILIIFHPAYIDTDTIPDLLNMLGQGMGIEAIAFAAITEERLTFYDLDGLPAADTGKIEALLAKAMEPKG